MFHHYNHHIVIPLWSPPVSGPRAQDLFEGDVALSFWLVIKADDPRVQINLENRAPVQAAWKEGGPQLGGVLRKICECGINWYVYVEILHLYI